MSRASDLGRLEGVAKAWINLDGTGTISTNDSFNISGTTDNGTGDYTFTINNDMNNNDYSHIGSAYFDGVTNTILSFGLLENTAFTSTRTTELIRYESIYVNAGSNRTNFDAPECCATIHGDLA